MCSVVLFSISTFATEYNYSHIAWMCPKSWHLDVNLILKIPPTCIMPEFPRMVLAYKFLLKLSISFIGVSKAVSVVVGMNMRWLKPDLDYPEKKVQVFCHLSPWQAQNLGDLLEHICRIRYHNITENCDCSQQSLVWGQKLPNIPYHIPSLCPSHTSF